MMPTITTNGTGRHSAGYDSLGTLQMLEVSRGELPREYDSWEQVNGKIPAEWRNGGALFPTPNTMDGLPARSGAALEKARKRGDESRETLTTISNLREAVIHELLPTPVASEGLKAPAQQTTEEKSKTGQVWLSNAAKDMEISWGRFEPAIRRWERVTGRSAPAPTQADGKDGAHRLSSKFTEWMMGLPDGWVTDCGLTRNEELKACGNGVVPQQAALALRQMLGAEA